MALSSASFRTQLFILPCLRLFAHLFPVRQTFTHPERWQRGLLLPSRCNQQLLFPLVFRPFLAYTAAIADLPCILRALGLGQGRSRCLSIKIIRLAPFLQADDLPFADVLPAHDVQQVFDDAGIHFGTSARAVFNPALTLWAFPSQVLGVDKSCRAAVLRVLVVVVALERGPCASDTAAYCRARARIPAAVLRRLALQVSRQLDDTIPTSWLWQGKHVHLVDGLTVSLPDTPANQRAYPQPPAQKPGLGFPLLRLVVLMSLATATLHGMAFGPYQGKKTGETALFRQLLDDLRPGTALRADRYDCSYFLVALALRRGVEVVFRLHQRRGVDFRRGRRLGVDDHVVTWQRPARPDWMDAATYAALPPTLTVREVRTQVRRPGYRIRELVVVTTLTDAETYRHDAITDWYHERWHVELDIRSLKQYMGMDQLRVRHQQWSRRKSGRTC